MIRTYFAKLLGRINDRHFRVFMAIHNQRANPYWMADRREIRDRGAFMWIMIPSDRAYQDRAFPYIVG